MAWTGRRCGHPTRSCCRSPARAPISISCWAKCWVSSATRIPTSAAVFAGDNTRDTYRSPLTVPGVDVHAGEYLLAVDGQELKAPVDPYSLLVGKQDSTLKLTVSDSATGKRRDVIVEPVKNELPLREQAWIDHNREVVEKASGGRVAYIYLSDMSGRGMDQFVRQFYSQLDKQALI